MYRRSSRSRWMKWPYDEWLLTLYEGYLKLQCNYIFPPPFPPSTFSHLPSLLSLNPGLFSFIVSTCGFFSSPKNVNITCSDSIMSLACICLEADHWYWLTSWEIFSVSIPSLAIVLCLRLQRTYCGPSPNWYIYNAAAVPKAPEILWKMGQQILTVSGTGSLLQDGIPRNTDPF